MLKNQILGILKALIFTLVCGAILGVLEYYKAEFEDQVRDTKRVDIFSFLKFVLQFQSIIIAVIGSKQEEFIINSSLEEKPYNYSSLRLSTFFKIAIVKWINNSV